MFPKFSTESTPGTNSVADEVLKKGALLAQAADSTIGIDCAVASNCRRMASCALSLNGEYAEGHFYLAVTLEKMGRSPEARQHWRAYQFLAPDGEWVDLAREFGDDPPR